MTAASPRYNNCWQSQALGSCDRCHIDLAQDHRDTDGRGDQSGDFACVLFWRRSTGLKSDVIVWHQLAIEVGFVGIRAAFEAMMQIRYFEMKAA